MSEKIFKLEIFRKLRLGSRVARLNIEESESYEELCYQGTELSSHRPQQERFIYDPDLFTNGNTGAADADYDFPVPSG